MNQIFTLQYNELYFNNFEKLLRWRNRVKREGGEFQFKKDYLSNFITIIIQCIIFKLNSKE